MVAVRQSVMVTRSESVRTDYGHAYTDTLSIQAEFERQLRDDPTFYLHQMFAWERPRKCATPPDPAHSAAVFYDQDDKRVSTDFPWALPPTDPRNPGASTTADSPGQWPAACGPSWTYPATGQDVPGFTYQTDRAEIIPPTPDSPVVTLEVLSRYGQSEAGLTATYRVPAVSDYTVYSGSDLRLSSVYTSTVPGFTSPIQGNVYADGSLWMPTDTGSRLDGASLYAEGGLVGNPGGQVSVYSGSPPQYTDPDSTVRDIRTQVDAPRTMASLSASTSDLADIACGGVSSGNVVNTGDYTTQLCLNAGAPARDVAGNLVTFPDHVAAWMILPDGNDLRVYTAATMDRPPGDCAISCDLDALGQTGSSPGDDPATGGVWSFQGAFLYPASGVVATDADTYFSRCANALTANSADCGSATWPGASVPGGGVVVAKSLTVVAGTSANPADLWVQGPVATSPTQVHLGLVATGRVQIPFWSHTPGGDLKVAASLLALNLGSAGGDPITSYPAQFSQATPAAAAAWGKSLTIFGSIAGPSFTSPVGGFGSVSVLADPTLAAGGPPSFPGFSSTIARVTNQRQEPSAFCGQEACYGRW